MKIIFSDCDSLRMSSVYRVTALPGFECIDADIDTWFEWNHGAGESMLMVGRHRMGRWGKAW